MAESYHGTVPCGACGARLREESEGGAALCWKCRKDNRVLRFRPFRQFQAPKPVNEDSGAPCAYHTGNQAVVSCARCGSFICQLCVTLIAGQDHCPPCFERMHASGGHQNFKSQFSRPHLNGFLIAFLGAGIPFFGLIAIGLALWQSIVAVRQRRELLKHEISVLSLVVITWLMCLGGVGVSIALVAGLMS